MKLFRRKNGGGFRGLFKYPSFGRKKNNQQVPEQKQEDQQNEIIPEKQDEITPEQKQQDDIIPEEKQQDEITPDKNQQDENPVQEIERQKSESEKRREKLEEEFKKIKTVKDLDNKIQEMINNYTLSRGKCMASCKKLMKSDEIKQLLDFIDEKSDAEVANMCKNITNEDKNCIEFIYSINDLDYITLRIDKIMKNLDNKMVDIIEEEKITNDQINNIENVDIKDIKDDIPITDIDKLQYIKLYMLKLQKKIVQEKKKKIPDGNTSDILKYLRWK